MTDSAPRNRAVLWLAATAVAVPLALAVAYHAWSWSCERRLAAVVEAIRRDGAPVAVADLDRLPPVPEAEDAAADLRAAASLIDTEAEAWRSYRSATYTDPLNEPAKRALRAVLELESAGEALQRIRAARGKSGASWRPPVTSPLSLSKLPELDKLWAVSELCRAAALDAHLRGDDAAAVEYLRDLLGVGRAAGRHPMMWGHFTATGAASTAADVIARDAAGMRLGGMRLGAAPAGARGGTPATPEQVRALIDELLDDVQLRESFLRGLRDERVAQLDLIRAIADGRLSVGGVAAAYGMEAGDVPLVPRPKALSDGRVVLEYTNGLLKAVESCTDYPSFKAVAPPSPALALATSRLAAVRGAELKRVLLLPIEQAPTVQFRCTAERRLAAAALAVRWYQSEHSGRPPESLDELVPTYLPAVPSDPFGAQGAALRYVAAGQRVLVYSVGENGLDNGGSTRAANPNRFSPVTSPVGRWEQLDVVYTLTERMQNAE